MLGGHRTTTQTSSGPLSQPPVIPSHFRCHELISNSLQSYFMQSNRCDCLTLHLSIALFTHTRSVYMTVLSVRPPLRPLKHRLLVSFNSNTKYSVKIEKTNKMQQSDVYYQLLSQHVSGIIMLIFRRTKTLLLHMVCCVGSAGCGW